jgi:hypothetical protein
MNTIQINGVTIQASGNIEVKNGRVYVNGKEVTGDFVQGKEIKIEVTGNVEKIRVDAGDIKINGNAEYVTSTSGDIRVSGNVNGNASTVSGDITCNKIGGNATTVSGDLVVREGNNKFS